MKIDSLGVARRKALYGKNCNSDKKYQMCVDRGDIVTSQLGKILLAAQILIVNTL